MPRALGVDSLRPDLQIRPYLRYEIEFRDRN